MVISRSPPLKPYTFSSILLFVRDSVWLLSLIIPTIFYSLIKILVFKPKKDLKGKIVLVTGAGNGLGKEIALQLSSHGCTVICVDVRKGDNKNTVEQIIENKGSGKDYYCDVSKPSEVKALSDIILDDFGKIDILINNAGLIFGNGILTGTIEEIRRVVDVNFLSNIWMIRAFLPSMIERKEGHIVCISSAAGIHSLAQGNIYSGTKFALVGMIYSLIEEFRQTANLKNIKISCALPYFINTNKLYSEHWKLRLPPLSTQKAATLVIKGIQQEYMFFTVPWVAIGYTVSTLYRLLPFNLYFKFREKFYTDFTFEDTTQTKL